MNNINKLVILSAVILAVGMISGFGGSHMTSDMTSDRNTQVIPTIDVHQINAQIFGNKNFTAGIPSYLTEESPSGVMPSSLLITARSPGNSTLSLSINGSYVDTIQGIPIHNLPFVNITTLYFVAPVSNETFLISVHSDVMNYTRTFQYNGNVKTPTQFITYETAKRVVPISTGISLYIAFYIFALPAGIAMIPAFEIAFYYVHTKRSKPNLDNDLIGERRGM